LPDRAEYWRSQARWSTNISNKLLCTDVSWRACNCISGERIQVEHAAETDFFLIISTVCCYFIQGGKPVLSWD
jgi:hypothetical protein